MQVIETDGSVQLVEERRGSAGSQKNSERKTRSLAVEERRD